MLIHRRVACSIAVVLLVAACGRTELDQPVDDDGGSIAGTGGNAGGTRGEGGASGTGGIGVGAGGSIGGSPVGSAGHGGATGAAGRGGSNAAPVAPPRPAPPTGEPPMLPPAPTPMPPDFPLAPPSPLAPCRRCRRCRRSSRRRRRPAGPAAVRPRAADEQHNRNRTGGASVDAASRAAENHRAQSVVGSQLLGRPAPRSRESAHPCPTASRPAGSAGACRRRSGSKMRDRTALASGMVSASTTSSLRIRYGCGSWTR